MDLLRIVEQHAQPQEGGHDVEVLPRAAANLLAQREDGRPRREDNRVDGLDQLDSTRGDAALGLGVHRILEVHVGVGHVGIGRTGAAVHLVEQPLALKNLDILTNRHLRHSQLIGHVGDADKSVFVQIVENVLVSFRNT